ncbi:TNT domain-containing protein [Micromonospora coxensis]|uniref:TNT domain-containing protein n=1 Tax=Micromonospora coxensis TaxID=356852 RepID=UPI0034273896
MRRRRWLLAVVSGAALAIFPGGAQEAAPPSTVPQAAGLSDDGARPGGGGSRTADGDQRDGRAGWPGQPGQPGGQPGQPGQPGGPSGQPEPPGGGPSPARPGLCRPGVPPNAPQTTRFYDDNRLLGPEALPLQSPVGPLLAGYQRFGAQSEAQWIRNYTVNGAGAQLVFPPENGFVLGPDGEPVKQRQTLLPGYRLDRFGFPGGAFLAPLGTPFGSRSLAPQSLNTPPTPPATTPPAPLANYHTYCVLKPFDVDSGPIAPWFAQPGMGTQFQLNPAYVPPAGNNLTVQWLLDHHFIVEENLGGPTPPPCPTDAVPLPVPLEGGQGGGLPTVQVC